MARPSTPAVNRYRYLPPGGATGETLIKASGSNYDVTWGDAVGGIDLTELNNTVNNLITRIGELEALPKKLFVTGVTGLYIDFLTYGYPKPAGLSGFTHQRLSEVYNIFRDGILLNYDVTLTNINHYYYDTLNDRFEFADPSTANREYIIVQVGL